MDFSKIKVKYVELQDAAKSFNKNCGTEIKFTGVKADAIKEALYNAYNEGLENVPEETAAFCEKYFTTPPVEEVTRYGNTEDIIALHAKNVSFDIKHLGLQDAEDAVIEAIAALTEDEWSALPEETQKWDIETFDKSKAMAEAEKAEDAPATPKETDDATGDDATGDDATGDDATGKTEDDAPKKGKEPRPDFRFTEGTNAHHIMTIFEGLFGKSNGEGIEQKDLIDACERAKVKSNNVAGRVATVIRYAATPNGGSQVSRVGTKIFPAEPLPAE